MNTSFIHTRLKQKIDSLDNWINSTLILLSGEIAVVDMGNGKFRMKVGDGVSTFNDLPYVSGGTAVNIDSHSAVDEFSVIHISKDEYEQRVAANNGSILSNVLYIVSSDVIDARGERIANLGNPVDLSDAVNLGYADSHYLTEHQSLSGYYTKSETNQLSTAFRYGLATTSELTAYETKADHNSGINILSNAISSKVLVDGQYAENIQLKNVTIEEYAQLLKEGNALSNCIYNVSSDNFEAFGNKIVNAADPEDDQDVATKHYVDTKVGTAVQDVTVNGASVVDTADHIAKINLSALDNVQIPTDLSSFTNSPGYLVSNDISNYYQKSETSSATEIAEAIDSIRNMISTAMTSTYEYTQEEIEGDSNI